MRLPRLDYPGARHHVMNRGARHEPVFRDEEDRRLFLQVLSELPLRFGVRVHAYALMPNHYHLLLESLGGRLPRAMRHLGGEFVRLLNARNRWDGPVFRGRYRNRLVGTEAYWRHLLFYVHLNPSRAGLTDPTAAAWTSHRAYVTPSSAPGWLETRELLDLCGGAREYLRRYRGVADGSEKAPAEFDPKRLWTPDFTGTTDFRSLAAPDLRIADALVTVSSVVGKSVPELVHSALGPRGNRDKWLTAWWLSRGRGISHGAIGRVLGVSPQTLSQRIARVERALKQDQEAQAWIRTLRELLTGNT